MPTSAEMQEHLAIATDAVLTATAALRTESRTRKTQNVLLVLAILFTIALGVFTLVESRQNAKDNCEGVNESKQTLILVLTYLAERDEVIDEEEQKILDDLTGSTLSLRDC